MGQIGPGPDDQNLHTQGHKQGPYIRKTPEQKPHYNKLQSIRQHRCKRLRIDEIRNSAGMNGKTAIKVCQKIIANKEQRNDEPVSFSIKGLKINLVRIMKYPDKRKGSVTRITSSSLTPLTIVRFFTVSFFITRYPNRSNNHTCAYSFFSNV